MCFICYRWMALNSLIRGIPECTTVWCDLPVSDRVVKIHDYEIFILKMIQGARRLSVSPMCVDIFNNCGITFH